MSTQNGVRSNAAAAEQSPMNWIPIDVAQFAFTPRKLRVICVGAGFSGLSLAYKVKHEKDFKDYVDFKIYDKNGGVGGTWRENRFPGLCWYASYPEFKGSKKRLMIVADSDSPARMLS